MLKDEDPNLELPDAHLAKVIVQNGWNRASEVYRPDRAAGDAFGHTAAEHRDWLDPIFKHLPTRTKVLDLGCGCGVPDSEMLSQQFEVLGVDISERQIERATKLVPRATFRQEDMTGIDFAPSTFGAVISLYSLIHVPLVQQQPLLNRIRKWLTPHGWLILITGHRAWEGTDADWLGSGGTMYWSHADAATYRSWLTELSFEIVSQKFIPEGDSGHELFQAKVQ